MSLSPAIAAIIAQRVDRALGLEVSPATIGEDIRAVLSGMTLDDARRFAARISDAGMEYLVATAPDEPETPPAEPAPIPTDPGPTPASPAASAAPAPPEEPAPAEAVADTEAA